jgi:hypothetical protein
VPRHRLTVYLHVGPPKTGTTYLQDVLWRNRSLSRSRDLDLAGARPVDHFYAALDLRGINFGGHVNPDVAGAWDRLAARALATDLGKVVISHEVLAGATKAEINRAVASLAPARVHVVYGARDLARQLPAVWQESLKNRRSRTFEAFLSAVLSEKQSGEIRGFWRAQDPVSTLQRWSSAVPREHIALMTLPQAGAPADTLWKRFCAALSLDPSGYDLDVARPNPSLPAEDAEVLRRLNEKLPEEFSWPAYEYTVKRRFNARANSAGPGSAGTSLVVPERYHAAVTERTRQIRDALESAGYPVIGHLDDLLPAPAAFGESARLSPDRVADAAVEILAAVLTESAPSRVSSRRVRARHRAKGLRNRLRRR